MYFVCTWAAFACSLFWLNRFRGRRVFESVPAWDEGVVWRLRARASASLSTNGGGSKELLSAVSLNWKACVLFSCGFVGGIFSAISGSGIDICTFSILTLLFRVSEKVATPTSVVLMAINTLVGFMYRQLAMGGVAPEAVRFFIVCAPVVVIGAPLGSLLGSHFHRLVLASLIYITDGVQFIGALAIVRPWSYHKTDTPVILSVTSLAILVLGSVVFALLAKTGGRLLDSLERGEKASVECSSSDSREGEMTRTREGRVLSSGSDRPHTMTGTAGADTGMETASSVYEAMAV